MALVEKYVKRFILILLQNNPMKEISLRPYPGRLFFVTSKNAYKKAHQRLFKESDQISLGIDGRFAGVSNDTGQWTYLVYASKFHTLAHELSHVILHIFEVCDIDPREGNGEPFCYMMSQLTSEAKWK